MLDVGTGLGFFSVACHNRGAEVFGIDLDREGLCYLESEWGILGERIDIERQAWPAGPFDLVFIGEVLEHVEQPRAVFAAARDALVTGGDLVITTPALEGFLTDSPGKRLGHQEGTERHHRDGFTSAELVEFLEGEGFRIRRAEMCIFLGAELFMQLTKLVYLHGAKTYSGQSEILRKQQTFSFRILRLFYPILLQLFLGEDLISRRCALNGHAHLIWATRGE